jgi:hypothetical protein
MIYTIKIKDKTKKARSIINMLKAFREDYDFIEIVENADGDIPEEQFRELEDRYESYQKNKAGKDWSVLKNELNQI